MAVKSSHWFEVAILFAGLLVGSFAQGIIANSRLKDHISKHDAQISKLADNDAQNYSALQASFLRRDEKTSAKIDNISEGMSEILQRLARMDERWDAAGRKAR